MAGSFNVFPPPWERKGPTKWRSAAKCEFWVHREQQRQTTVSRTKDSKWQSPEDDANVVGLNAGKIEMRKKHKSFFKLLIW